MAPRQISMKARGTKVEPPARFALGHVVRLMVDVPTASRVYRAGTEATILQVFGRVILGDSPKAEFLYGIGDGTGVWVGPLRESDLEPRTKSRKKRTTEQGQTLPLPLETEAA